MKFFSVMIICIFCSFSYAKDTAKRKPSNVNNGDEKVLFNCEIQMLRILPQEVAGVFICSDKLSFEKKRDGVFRGFIAKDANLRSAVIAANFNKLPISVKGVIQEQEETKRLLITEIESRINE